MNMFKGSAESTKTKKFGGKVLTKNQKKLDEEFDSCVDALYEGLNSYLEAMDEIEISNFVTVGEFRDVLLESYTRDEIITLRINDLIQDEMIIKSAIDIANGQKDVGVNKDVEFYSLDSCECY